jgi:hypothetical protein
MSLFRESEVASAEHRELNPLLCSEDDPRLRGITHIRPLTGTPVPPGGNATPKLPAERGIPGQPNWGESDASGDDGDKPEAPRGISQQPEKRPRDPTSSDEDKPKDTEAKPTLRRSERVKKRAKTVPPKTVHPVDSDGEEELESSEEFPMDHDEEEEEEEEELDRGRKGRGNRRGARSTRGRSASAPIKEEEAEGFLEHAVRNR